MVDSGRVQIAGFVAIAVVIAGVSAVQDARERQPAALPLMLPAAAGYHASGAGAANGGLSVSMSPDAPAGSGLSSLPAFVVNITPREQHLNRTGIRREARGVRVPSAAPRMPGTETPPVATP